MSLRKLFIFTLLPFSLCSCQVGKKSKDYGAYLGRDKDITGFKDYEYVSYSALDFTKEQNKEVSESGTKILAYLNIGSLETFHDDYDQYVDITFKDYENWPDERWVDVTQSKWQKRVLSFAKEIKNNYAYGVYLDNVDVYTVSEEEGLDYQAFASSLKTMMKQISSLGLKIMINGGSHFIEDMNKKKDDVFKYIWAYHQEEVFSLIKDYDNDKFGKQDKEEQTFYQEISSLMKKKGKEVFYLEYTTDSSLKKEIKKYCDKNNYHFYISNNVDLK